MRLKIHCGIALVNSWGGTTRRLTTKQINELVDALELEVSVFFTADEIEQLALESGFRRRASGKVDGETFLRLIVFNRESLKDQSLDALCIKLFETHGIELRKQSLHERFNAQAVCLLKKALEMLLAKYFRQQQMLKELFGFKRVLIKDSTSFQLSDNLADAFRGCGGASSKAGVRIQFEFNILSGSIEALALSEYVVQDATDSVATLEMVRAGDLIIRDLAYMHFDVLRGIMIANGFFCCRLQATSVVYEDAALREKLNFGRLRTQMRKQGISRLEKTVYLGSSKPIMLRLIISLIPEQALEQRLRGRTKKQKNKGRTKLSKEYMIRSHFNLFVTNASAQQLPLTAVEAVYKLRWFVELVFKTWKSTWRIHQIKPVNQYRMSCYIFARLIALVVSWKFIWSIIHHTVRIARVVPSMDKCNKLLFSHLEVLVELFCGAMQNIKDFVALVGSRINVLLSERRKKRPTQLEQIINGMLGSSSLA